MRSGVHASNPEDEDRPERPARTRDQDTIVAIATPPGRGGIGIVRLSGPLAMTCVHHLCRLQAPLEPGRVRLVDIFDPETQTRIDQGIVTWFRAPHSYTGEDVVEIAAHGAPVVLELLVRESLHAGARLAEPGEFTARAFLSGRIDLTQAEAVRDLIEAQTVYQARIAAEQLGGALSRRVRPVKDDLLNLIAALEAGIDFAEDDTPVMPAAEIVTVIDTIRAKLGELEQSFAHGRLIHSGITLAIAGRPNVGKSSLFNRLVGQDRAIVTAAPGTTRDLVSEQVALNGLPVRLIDTAGLRESEDEAEQIGVRKSREVLAEADLVLVVVDASAGLSDEERGLTSDLGGRRAIVVLNKSDLVADPEAARAEVVSRLELAALSVVCTSALTGTGIDRLRREIAATLQLPTSAPSGGMLTNLRQHLAVTASSAALMLARTAASAAVPDEMVLLDLYAALRELDLLTGATTIDDVLNKVFSTFCIGK